MADNVARGGKAENAPITNELEEIAMRAARAVGGRGARRRFNGR